jgi:hypothetical protein
VMKHVADACRKHGLKLIVDPFFRSFAECIHMLVSGAAPLAPHIHARPPSTPAGPERLRPRRRTQPHASRAPPWARGMAGPATPQNAAGGAGGGGRLVALPLLLPLIHPFPLLTRRPVGRQISHQCTFAARTVTFCARVEIHFEVQFEDFPLFLDWPNVCIGRPSEHFAAGGRHDVVSKKTVAIVGRS